MKIRFRFVAVDCNSNIRVCRINSEFTISFFFLHLFSKVPTHHSTGTQARSFKDLKEIVAFVIIVVLDGVLTNIFLLSFIEKIYFYLARTISCCCV